MGKEWPVPGLGSLASWALGIVKATSSRVFRCPTEHVAVLGRLRDSDPGTPVSAQETVFSANAPSLRAGHNTPIAFRQVQDQLISIKFRTSLFLSSSGPAHFHQVQEHLLVQQVFKEWDINGEACASHPLRVGPGFVGPTLIQFRNKENSTTSSVQNQGQGLGRHLYMAETLKLKRF